MIGRSRTAKATTRAAAIAGAALALAVGATARAEPDATIVIESRTMRPGDMSFNVRLDTDTRVDGTDNAVIFDPRAPRSLSMKVRQSVIEFSVARARCDAPS